MKDVFYLFGKFGPVCLLVICVGVSVLGILRFDF